MAAADTCTYTATSDELFGGSVNPQSYVPATYLGKLQRPCCCWDYLLIHEPDHSLCCLQQLLLHPHHQQRLPISTCHGPGVIVPVP
jgi:hypothetical protein